MPTVDTYSLAQIKEIYTLFSEDQYYTNLYNAFYSGAPKKVQQEAIRIRNEIIHMAKSAIDSGDRRFTLPELSKKLTEFTETAYAITKSLQVKEKNDENNIKLTKVLLSIIDSFSTKFKFESTTDYASSLVSSSPDKKIPENFTNLQVYRALAKRKIALMEGKEHTYTHKETELLSEKFNVKDIHELDDKFTLEEIYTELNQAYLNVCEVPFVKTTLKTNFLKSAGIHRKNVAIGLITALGIAAVFSLSPVAGAPTVNPSTQAILNFISSQMMPIAGIGLLGGTAASTLSAIIDNRTTQHLREQIRLLSSENKEKLFNLTAQYTEKIKNGILSPKEAFKSLDADLKSIGIKFDWGIRKMAKFNHLLDSSQISTELPGATKRQQKVKRKLEANLTTETSKAPNNEILLEKISQILSPKNPICQLIGVKGCKSRKKAPNPKTVTEDPARAPTVLPAYPREKADPEVTTDTAEEQLKAAIENPSMTHATIDYGGHKIEISKANFKKNSALTKLWLKSAEVKGIVKDIREYLATGNENEAEYTYERGMETKKDKKPSIKVTIKPKK